MIWQWRSYWLHLKSCMLRSWHGTKYVSGELGYYGRSYMALQLLDVIYCKQGRKAVGGVVRGKRGSLEMRLGTEYEYSVLTLSAKTQRLSLMLAAELSRPEVLTMETA